MFQEVAAGARKPSPPEGGQGMAKPSKLNPPWQFRGYPGIAFAISCDGVNWTNLNGVGANFLMQYWRDDPIGECFVQWLSEQHSLKRLEMASDYLSALEDPH